MMYNALSAAVQDMGGAFSPERLALAGQVTLIGMGMVFSVLAILWAVLAIFKRIFAPAAPVKKAEPAPIVAAPAPAEETVEAVSDDGELVAVITAAVAAYIASEDPAMAQSGFRVVSFRRANGGKAWNAK